MIHSKNKDLAIMPFPSTMLYFSHIIPVIFIKLIVLHCQSLTHDLLVELNLQPHEQFRSILDT